MNKKNDFTALRRRLYLRMLLIAAFAVALILLVKEVGSGRFAAPAINALVRFLRVDIKTAESIYFYGIRRYLGVLLAIGAIALFMLLFKAFLKHFTGYLDEISAAVEAITGDTSAPISLSPELSPMETKLKSLQQRLERQQAQSLQAQQRKNDLVIYSAHDIKTPLTSALGYLILLDSDPDMPRENRTKYTGIALDKTRELESMINELFEITRYNLNEIEPEKSWVNLYYMLSEIKEEHYPRLKAANKRVELSVEESLSVFADADKLARAFSNIVGNALLYSEPDSSIYITAFSREDRVVIAVENSCPPLPQAKLDRLFDQFYRGREAHNANISGSGLGLAIAKEIVLLHGGAISAESTEKGLCLTVSLPIKKN